MPEPIRSTTHNAYLDQANLAARSYQRHRHLPGLLALWPSQIDDFGIEGTTDIIRQLDSALQAERRRGRARHWCYDLNRHLALISALKAEQKSLAMLNRTSPSAKVTV